METYEDESEVRAIEAESSPEPESVHRNGENRIICHGSLCCIKIQKANHLQRKGTVRKKAGTMRAYARPCRSCPEWVLTITTTPS